MTVTIRFVKDDEEVTFLLASREESGSPIDVYSPRSPLGAAIMGKKVGEKATYSLPNGRANTVEILEAVPYVGRLEVKILNQAERAVVTATTARSGCSGVAAPVTTRARPAGWRPRLRRAPGRAAGPP